MAFSLTTILARLFSKWSNQPISILRPNDLFDDFSTPGPPDPTKWSIFVGAPVVAGGDLLLAGGDAVLALPAYAFTYGYIEWDIDLVGQTNVDLYLEIRDITWPASLEGIMVIITQGVSAVTFITRDAAGSTGQFTSFVPSVNTVRVTWDKGTASLYIDGNHYWTFTTNVPNILGLVWMSNNFQTAKISEVRVGYDGEATVRFIDKKKLDYFADSKTSLSTSGDVFQADAILSLPGNHSVPISSGCHVVIDGVDYLVKEKLEVELDAELVDEELVERWALWRDQTGPGQVTGVR